MSSIKEALTAIYLSPLKENPQAFIGVELEFPIVNLSGQGTDSQVGKALLTDLGEQPDFRVEKVDADGQIVQLCHTPTGDVLLFEVSYNILEFAFAKARSIQEIDHRFQTLLKRVQAFLRARGHELQGQGIHPGWQQNDNAPVKLPRYEMLVAYLGLGKTQGCHPFLDYGGFICGNQVQLDVSRSNYLRVLNAFNKIEAAKAFLFANSSFQAADWDTTIARDRFWEDSMHGLIPENVGLFPRDFQDEDQYLDYLSQTAMFTLTRGETTYYFPPVTVTDFLNLETIEAYQSPQHKTRLHPQLADLASHRPYHYQLLTRRGTVEFRSVCAQPLDRTFTPTAFHVGLLANLAELEDFLGTSDFFSLFGRDYPRLRRLFSQKNLSPDQVQAVATFAQELIRIALKGLIQRGLGEETYLLPLLNDPDR